ncbi:uncharacterized protein BO72DRAFT_518915 [Aspergillus fijiensis CBS 313.89]|uniref:Uncharacterized protein n=1 Tax=Aspergillus fijiensis CBS 313.89 TaxID=1448319 RepID=A0A8G1VVP8_9EURO|nr:uncharacterized protein BO72DRAFT_518915 [Aspergillus fijiensis CBS 313.89]RAK73428.1 hypothetical protein BO72DRAFT_518915 [Aspergillus fijiensis CBS 313.89]
MTDESFRGGWKWKWSFIWPETGFSFSTCIHHLILKQGGVETDVQLLAGRATHRYCGLVVSQSAIISSGNLPLSLSRAPAHLPQISWSSSPPFICIPSLHLPSLILLYLPTFYLPPSSFFLPLLLSPPPSSLRFASPPLFYNLIRPPSSLLSSIAPSYPILPIYYRLPIPDYSPPRPQQQPTAPTSSYSICSSSLIIVATRYSALTSSSSD